MFSAQPDFAAVQAYEQLSTALCQVYASTRRQVYSQVQKALSVSGSAGAGEAERMQGFRLILLRFLKAKGLPINTLEPSQSSAVGLSACYSIAAHK